MSAVFNCLVNNEAGVDYKNKLTELSFHLNEVADRINGNLVLRVIDFGKTKSAIEMVDAALCVPPNNSMGYSYIKDKWGVLHALHSNIVLKVGDMRRNNKFPLSATNNLVLNLINSFLNFNKCYADILHDTFDPGLINSSK